MIPDKYLTVKRLREFLGSLDPSFDDMVMDTSGGTGIALWLTQYTPDNLDQFKDVAYIRMTTTVDEKWVPMLVDAKTPEEYFRKYSDKKYPEPRYNIATGEFEGEDEGEELPVEAARPPVNWAPAPARRVVQGAFREMQDMAADNAQAAAQELGDVNI